MFRDMGVYASRATHAQLYLNGEYLGVFSMVEQVDGRFADYNFPSAGEGNVYKERWPTSLNPQYYVDGLKTNEDAAAVGAMVAYAGAILGATDPRRSRSATILGAVPNSSGSAERTLPGGLVPGARNSVATPAPAAGSVVCYTRTTTLPQWMPAPSARRHRS
jgi:hypothetical protein